MFQVGDDSRSVRRVALDAVQLETPLNLFEPRFDATSSFGLVEKVAKEERHEGFNRGEPLDCHQSERLGPVDREQESSRMPMKSAFCSSL